MLRPVLDFAACIVIFVATSTTAAWMFKLSSLIPFDVSPTFIQVANNDVVASGTLLTVALILFAPGFLLGRRRGIQDARITLINALPLIVGVPMIIYLLSGVLSDPAGPFAPFHFDLDVNILRDIIGLLISIATLALILRATPMVQYRYRLWLWKRGAKQRRVYYEASVRLRNKTYADENEHKRLSKIVDPQIRLRKRRRIIQHRSRIIELTKATGSAPIYMFVVCCTFVSTAFTLGTIRSQLINNYDVIKGSTPAQFVAAIYPDYMLTVCYDPLKGTYASGFRYQRLDDKGSHMDIVPSHVVVNKHAVHLMRDQSRDCNGLVASTAALNNVTSKRHVK